MAIKNSVSMVFGSTFVISFNIFDCHISGVYLVCSNNDPRLALTYLLLRPNLIPNPFKWGKFGKKYFLKTVDDKVIILF